MTREGEAEASDAAAAAPTTEERDRRPREKRGAAATTALAEGEEAAAAVVLERTQPQCCCWSNRAGIVSAESWKRNEESERGRGRRLLGQQKISLFVSFPLLTQGPSFFVDCKPTPPARPYALASCRLSHATSKTASIASRLALPGVATGGRRRGRRGR